MAEQIPGFHSFAFKHNGIDHTVYKAGTGPGILIMHELPGMARPCIDFAKRIIDAGFTVYLPHFFGTINKAFSNLDTSMNTMHICISREFHVFASDKTSPVVEWLRELSKLIHEECGGPGIGAIGMCLTGAFAIPLLVESPLLAPVVSQPILPFGPLESTKKNLGCSPSDLEKAVNRCHKEDINLLCFRFSNDPIAPAEKIETIREKFTTKSDITTIDSSPGNSHNIVESADAVFTFNFSDVTNHPTRLALDKVIAYYKEKLMV